MALPGQQIIGQGLTHLAALWPTPNRAAAKLRFKPVVLNRGNDAALTRAQGLYAGSLDFSVEDFQGLNWLEDFAQSGRQLLMCHALRLLESWAVHRAPTGSLAHEVNLLQVLARSAGPFATVLGADELDVFSLALRQQQGRIKKLKCHQPIDMMGKGLAYLDVARSLVGDAQFRNDAIHLFDQALPKLVDNDGGPTDMALASYVAWLTPLLNAKELPYAPGLQLALDRVKPFLSMLIGADGHFAFDPSCPVPECLKDSAPLMQSKSGVARLQRHKTVVVSAMNAFTHVSSRHYQVLTLSTEQSDDTMFERRESEQGDLLTQANRRIFLAPSGDDIRFEEQGQSSRSLQVQFNRDAKVSTSHHGKQAVIAIDGRNLWHMSIRGGSLLPNTDENGFTLMFDASTINWALRRVIKSHSRSAKDASPELPF